ncbi:MAG: aspartate aminotransferase family protein [Hyphomicrobiales bacterium]|jgi:adenosylmethionine-8-amino-7-oxononanoate aminotransferase
MKSRHVFPRHTKADLPIAVGGQGPFLIDADGKHYLDACGGAAVSCLGHSDEKLKASVHEQVDKLAYAHTSFFTTDPSEELAERLAALAPGELNRIYFVSGGSEAMESALKLARQFHMENGEPKRAKIIARWQSYHGNTLGALSAGGNRWRRTQFEPMLSPAMHHVSQCNAYRGKGAGESDDAYTDRLAQELDDAIQNLGPDSVAAFVAEPVVGATMGAVPPVAGYFRKMHAVCKKHGVLLILDEVMCGMGRTGTLFACEQEGIEPDMIAIAKGLGAGVQPIGALLVSDRIYDAIEAGSGFFQHGHTYLGHPMACAVGNAVLDRLVEDDVLARVKPTGERLRQAIIARFGNHPNVGDIRGRGLFLGLELVADRGTKDPFDPQLGVAAKIKKRAMAEGLMCYPMGGTIDGERGDHVLLAPPFIIEDEHIAMIVERLETAIIASLPY